MKNISFTLIALVFLFSSVRTKPIPTILDTDIGTDYDDQLALSFILSVPTIFDLKLVICSTYNTTARAQIVAKTLATYARFDVPIGIGRNTGIDSQYEYEWAENYTLAQFQQNGGIVYTNGEQALLLEMQKANINNTYYLIEISPATSLRYVVPQLSPETLKYIHVFAMAGSVMRGYGNSSQPSKEYNVVQDIPAAQVMFSAAWASFSLAPLDSTNFMQFFGSSWQEFLNFRNQSKHVALVIDSYTTWYNNGGKHNGALKPFSPTTGTSTMYDVLAAFMAATHPDTLGLQMATLQLLVTDDGYTQINTTHGREVDTCIGFTSENPYEITQFIGKMVLQLIMTSKI